MPLNSGAVASRVRLLRERDGDNCWLCGELIDFGLDPDDDMAKSIDHVVPRAAGGHSMMSNLRLAHRLCNTERGMSGP